MELTIKVNYSEGPVIPEKRMIMKSSFRRSLLIYDDSLKLCLLVRCEAAANFHHRSNHFNHKAQELTSSTIPRKSNEQKTEIFEKLKKIGGLGKLKITCKTEELMKRKQNEVN